MIKITSISFNKRFDPSIERHISKGRFQNASEVIQAGHQLIEEEEIKLTAFQNAIQEGIASGIAKDFDPQAYLKSLPLKKLPC